MTRVPPPAGAIIAGGRALRLGGIAKGLLRVGNQRIIDRVAAALRPNVGEMLIVADAADASAWLTGTRIVRDELRGGGAAAGIHAALRAVNGPVLAVAWDLPFVESSLCAALAKRGATGPFDAVVPRSAGDGQLEPMCAWYAPACADAIEATWNDGDRSLHGMLRRVRTEVLDTEHPARVFLNVNTEADLDYARDVVGDGESDVR